MSRKSILEQGLKILLEKKLQETKAEIFQITGKYAISSVEEMEERYKRGGYHQFEKEAFKW